jgi:hypothetical protein
MTYEQAEEKGNMTYPPTLRTQEQIVNWPKNAAVLKSTCMSPGSSTSCLGWYCLVAGELDLMWIWGKKKKINTFFISFHDICAAKQFWRHSIGPEQKDPAWRDGRYCGATRTNSELMCCFSFTSLVGISTYLNYFQNFQRIELQHARMYSATSQMNALCIFLQRCANLAFAKCWQEQYWSPIYRIYSHWSLQTLLAELSAISQMLLMLNSLLAIWFISENEEAGRVRWLCLSNWKTIHSRTLSACRKKVRDETMVPKSEMFPDLSICVRIICTL